MSKRMPALNAPWYWLPDRTRVLVDILKPGDVITGTGPSGDFETGPITVASRLPNRAESGRKPAFTVAFTDGTSCVWYGDTVVELAS